MKQILKRLFGTLLAIVMVVTMIPLEALTVSATGAASQSTVTTGDIIEYGSYPQTVVTDSALISALNSQTLQADSTTTYNGSKYKRVYFTNTTNIFQEGNGYFINTVYWFKFEPLQWRVLSNTNGELFVVAEKILTSKTYNQIHIDVTWETCTLRSWLNNDFYYTAFNPLERTKIKKSLVINDDTQLYEIYGYHSYANGGTDTNDNLFLLSNSEILNVALGFSTDTGLDPNRVAQGTDFAKCNGLYVIPDGLFPEISYWWLRSLALYPGSACCIGHDGVLYPYNTSVAATNIGIRPAFKINLSSDIFTSKANSAYNIKIVDADSSQPVPSATVSYNGTNYTTLADGTANIPIGTLPSPENQKITVAKIGYNTIEKPLEQLNRYAQTTISLVPQNSVANMIPSISTGTETINGPLLSFMGKEFSLFSFEGAINLPLNSSLSVSNNVDEKTIRIVGGISDGVSVNPDPNDPYWSESYRDVKSFVQRCGQTVDTTKLWNQYSSLRGKLKNLGPNVGFKCSGSIALYAEFDYSSGKTVLKEGGLVLIAEAAVSQSVPFAPIPVFYVKFELGGKFTGQFNWVFSGSGVLGPSGDCEFQVIPKVGVGVGVDKIANLEVGLKGTLSGTVKFNSQTLINPVLQEMFEAYIEAKFYAKYKLLLFEAEKEWNIFKVELYPNFGASKNAEYSLCREDMGMMSRDYLLTQTKHAQTNSTTVASIDKKSIYPNGVPELTTLSNGNILALWLDDDGTKTTANRTTLFYSVYNGSVWTTPATVCDSEFADFSATVCTNSSNVGILWQRGSEVFGDDVTLDDMLANTDLIYSSFDGTSFSTPQIVGTADNSTYETGYDIASNGTDLTAVWIQNSLNDYSLSTGINAVYAQTLSNGTWQDVETINANVPGISSLAVGYTANGREIACCADTDGDLTTSGDTELFVNNTNVTNNAVDDLNVKFENGSFWYKSNGELVKLNEDYTTTNTSNAFDGNYNVIGNGTSTAAVFTQSDDFSNQVMISSQNADGTFTTPVSLYDNDTLVNAFSAIMNVDGSITIAMDSKNLSTDPEAETPYTTTDFLVKEFGDSYDLQIGDSLSYDRTSVAPDADVELTTTIKNNSNVAMNGYTLTLTDGSGNYLADNKTVNESLASGATADVSIIYRLPSTIAGHEVELTVTPLADVIETDLTNNSISTQIGLGDLTVAAEIVENEQGALITATVTNSGYTTIDASSVSFTKIATDMDLLNTSAIGSLAPGQSEVVTYQVNNDKIEFLSEYTANSFVVEASTESDENDYANNDIRAMLEPVKVESVVLNEETLVLALDETYSLNATVAPINAINKAVYFVSDSTDVVTVDDEGNLVAVGTGTAIITVLTSDGGKVSSCTITVDNNRLEAAAESQLMMSTENDFITNIDLTKATPGDLRLMIANSMLRFVDATGDELPETSTVGTGTIVQLLNNSCLLLDEKQVVLFGDVNGDGNIDSLDAGTLVDYENYIITWDPIDDAAYNKAGDLNGDGSIDSIDAGTAVDAENYIVTVDQSTGLAAPV